MALHLLRRAGRVGGRVAGTAGGSAAGEATARSHHGWGGVKETAKGTKLLKASHWS